MRKAIDLYLDFLKITLIVIRGTVFFHNTPFLFGSA